MACIRNLRTLGGETFKRNMNISVDELFKDCYGIWNQPSIPVEDIELSYDALDGTTFLFGAKLVYESWMTEYKNMHSTEVRLLVLKVH